MTAIVTTTRTLAERIDDGLKSGAKVIPAKAHAAISKGMVVQIALATGLTSAPSANDRLGFFGVALEDVAKDAEGSFAIDGIVEMLSGSAITYGSLLDCSADMKVDPLADQTDGNGFARAIEGTASGADELIMAKIL